MLLGGSISLHTRIPPTPPRGSTENGAEVAVVWTYQETWSRVHSPGSTRRSTSTDKLSSDASLLM